MKANTNDINQKMDVTSEGSNKLNKTKAFKGLKIMNPNQDTVKSGEPMKFVDQDNKQWETGFTPSAKIPFNFYENCNSVQKFSNQLAFNNDSMKSPEYKFFFNSLYNLSATPTPLKQSSGFNYDKNFFPAQTPGQTPGHTPGQTPGLNLNSVGVSPNLSFGKDQQSNNCFFFPQPTNQNSKEMPPKDNITFGSNEESFGAGCNMNKNIPQKMTSNIPPTPSPPKEVKPKVERKGKKGGKTAKRKNLSVREDVMNKNIFRAFKRELKNIYNAHIGESALAEDKDVYKSKFIQTVGAFTEAIILEASFDPKIYKDFDMHVCKTFIGIFLDYCYMKKALKGADDKERLTTSFNVIYSYSHQKFYDFLAIPEIKVIFRTIMDKTGLENFLGNHESLGKEKYRTHLGTLLTKLEIATS